jgi:hypothetical protein
MRTLETMLSRFQAHPSAQEQVARKKHEIAQLATDELAKAMRCLETERTRKEEDLPHSTSNYKVTVQTIDLLLAMRAAGWSLSEVTDGCLELQALLEAHVNELIRPVLEGATAHAGAAAALSRVELAAECVLPQHLPAGVEPLVARVDATWSKLTQTLEELISKCTSLVREEQGEAGSLRTSVRATKRLSRACG